MVANATSAVAVLPGYLSGTIGLARALRNIERSVILRLTLWTLIGGLDWHGFGRRRVVLPISGLILIAAASVGAQPWTIAIILMITFGARIILQQTQ